MSLISTVLQGHPVAVYYMHKAGWGPPPKGLVLLFYMLYGEMRTCSSVHKATCVVGINKWREVVRATPWARAQLYGGTAFAPPEAWPDKWLEGWPAWVEPMHLLRAFGGPSATTPRKERHWKWCQFQGLPELAAYWTGLPLTREEMVLARRGAQRLIRTPQFTMWAYNVPVAGIRRQDLPFEYQAAAITQLTKNPLRAENTDIHLALPSWAQTSASHEKLARPFDPLRTQAPNLLRYEDTKLLSLEGPHIPSLPEGTELTCLDWRPMTTFVASEWGSYTRSHEGLKYIGRRRTSH